MLIVSSVFVTGYDHPKYRDEHHDAKQSTGRPVVTESVLATGAANPGHYGVFVI